MITVAGQPWTPNAFLMRSSFSTATGNEVPYLSRNASRAARSSSRSMAIRTSPWSLNSCWSAATAGTSRWQGSQPGKKNSSSTAFPRKADNGRGRPSVSCSTRLPTGTGGEIRRTPIAENASAFAAALPSPAGIIERAHAQPHVAANERSRRRSIRNPLLLDLPGTRTPGAVSGSARRPGRSRTPSSCAALAGAPLPGRCS